MLQSQHLYKNLKDYLKMNSRLFLRLSYKKAHLISILSAEINGSVLSAPKTVVYEVKPNDIPYTSMRSPSKRR